MYFGIAAIHFQDRDQDEHIAPSVVMIRGSEWFGFEVPVLTRHLHREPREAAKIAPSHAVSLLWFMVVLNVTTLAAYEDPERRWPWALGSARAIPPTCSGDTGGQQHPQTSAFVFGSTLVIFVSSISVEVRRARSIEIMALQFGRRQDPRTVWGNK